MWNLALLLPAIIVSMASKILLPAERDFETQRAQTSELSPGSIMKWIPLLSPAHGLYIEIEAFVQNREGSAH